MNAWYSVKRVRISGAFRVVRDDEILEPTDLVRCTSSNQHSDYVNHDALTRMNWHRIQDGLPAWIGKTLQEFYDRADRDPGYFEVIRPIKQQKAAQGDIEVLKSLRDFYSGSVLDHKEKAAALTRAIAALEAIENAKVRKVIPDQWDDVFAKYGNVVWCCDLEAGSEVLIIPAILKENAE